MRKLQNCLMLLLLTLCFAGLAHAQTALAQTTISSGITVGPSGSASGQATGSYQTTVTLASATGVQTAFNGTPITILYIDQEAMGVLSLSSGTTYNVVRGMYGTKATPHASGSMVLLQVITPQFGGNSGSGGLQTQDPPPGGCTATNTLVTPWVNMLTGHQWICSTITSVWVPGFNNPETLSVTTAVASVAGATLPSGPLFHITGTNAITSWTIPVGCNATTVGGCRFTVIPDAAFTTVAGNNIATSDTAVANLPIIFIWDATNSKFVSLQSK